MKTIGTTLAVLALFAVQPASASVDRSIDGKAVRTAASTAPTPDHPIRLAGRMVTGD
jgi:hypothetical protein